MIVEKLRNYMAKGNDVEFVYRGSRYSITKYVEGNKEGISFCEFYKEPIDAGDVDGLLAKEYHNESIKDIWESLDEKDLWIE